MKNVKKKIKKSIGDKEKIIKDCYRIAYNRINTRVNRERKIKEQKNKEYLLKILNENNQFLRERIKSLEEKLDNKNLKILEEKIESYLDILI